MRPLIEKYPQFYQDSEEFREMQNAMTPELANLWKAWESMMDQLDVNTASTGLKYWEMTMGIPVNESADLKDRRDRIKSKLRGAGVTTVSMVESVAASFVTSGKATVIEKPKEFAVEISADITGNEGFPNQQALEEALSEILPAHLKVDFSMLVRGTLMCYIGLTGSLYMEIRGK